MIKIAFCSYFWNSADEARIALSKQVPRHAFQWGDLVAVTEKDNPDYYVIFQNDNEFTKSISPEKKIYLQREPEEIQSYDEFKNKNKGHLQTLESSHQFVKWWVDQDYDYLEKLDFPTKNKNLNTVLSYKRDLEGHRHRSDFVMNFLDKYPKELDLFGSLTKIYPVLKHIRNYPNLERIYNHWLNLPFVNTFINFDKLEATLPFKYSFVAENSQHRNYFTEKIVDAYLAWNMPIYWGCTNLNEFFPEESYYNIDIFDENAVEFLYEISQKPLTKNNIEAIRESRNKILNEYNLWPALESYIKKII